MKKVLSILLAILFCLSITSCCFPSGTGDSNEVTDNSSEITTDLSDSTSDAAEVPNGDTAEETSTKITYQNVQTYTNSIDDTYIVTQAIIENTGTSTVRISGLSIDIEDKNGELLESLALPAAYPDVIAPGECAYIKEATSTVDGDNVGNAVINYTAEATKNTYTKLDVSEVKMEVDEYMGINVKGRIENTTDDTISMVYVVCPIFKDGELIALPYTIISNDILPGQKIGFEAGDLFEIPDTDYEGATCEPFAYPYELIF